jgi:hypothetical protein
MRKNKNTTPIEHLFCHREDLGMRLRAVPRLYILILDAELEVIWRRAVRDVGRGVNESLVDDVAIGVDVDDAEAAESGAASAGFLEDVAFAVESYGGARGDEG